MWLTAATSSGGGAGYLALWGTLAATTVAVLTSIATIIANRATKRKAEAEAAAVATSAEVDKGRLSLDGLVAYADRLEKENERLRHDLAERDAEVEELRDLRELIETMRGKQGKQR